MNHEERWTIYYEALKTYQQRYGDALVPTGHLEFLDNGAEINLGHWVSYMRTRYRQGLLSQRRIKLLEKVPSWTWGPVRPGPKSKNIVIDRNNKIKIAYEKGASASALAREYSLSRQWIYQIIKETT
tara:strand:- start:2135 stop:2515 length:381 start_codon:yes stop_codon:yes gene_type:complete